MDYLTKVLTPFWGLEVFVSTLAVSGGVWELSDSIKNILICVPEDEQRVLRVWTNDEVKWINNRIVIFGWEQSL